MAAAIGKTITEWDEFSGRLEAVDRVEIRHACPAPSTRCTSARALVKKGDLLFTIDPRPMRRRWHAPRRRWPRPVRATHAQTEQARAQRLLQDNAVSRREFDERDNGAREAAANVRAARPSWKRRG